MRDKSLRHLQESVRVDSRQLSGAALNQTKTHTEMQRQVENAMVFVHS